MKIMYYTIRLSSIIVLSFIIISFVFFTNPAFGASGLKVFVNLQHNEKGSAKVCVSSYNENLGCDTINLSKYNSPTELGPWQFTTGIIPVGESFTVCVTNLDTDKEKCKDGTNTPKKAPEYITITVPSTFNQKSQTERVFGSSESESNYNHYNDYKKSNSINKKGINWGEICKDLDFLISEPCSTLTTDGGYTLTEEGEHALQNILCGGVALGGLAAAFISGNPLFAGAGSFCGNSNANNNMNQQSLLSGLLGK